MEIKKYSKKGIIISIISIILVIVFINFITPSTQKKLCQESDRFMRMSLHGVIEEKYIDRDNHDYPIVELKDFQTSETIRLNFILDRSDFFSVVSKGDTISKKKGTIEFLINSDRRLELRFSDNCEEYN